MADAKLARAKQVERPMSPHLQIYKPLINMVMSILHRMTGAALYLGAVLLAWWLMAATTGPEYFDYVNGLFGTLIGRVVVLGYTWALINHALGGIRHFIWDMGLGYDNKTVDLLSWGTLAISLGLTLAIWLATGQLSALLKQIGL